jgi:hypothetical protein
MSRFRIFRLILSSIAHCASLCPLTHVRPEYIKHQLAYAVRDPLGRAYNRTTHLEERRRMMQTWADYLDGLAFVFFSLASLCFL